MHWMHYAINCSSFQIPTVFPRDRQLTRSVLTGMSAYSHLQTDVLLRGLLKDAHTHTLWIKAIPLHNICNHSKTVVEQENYETWYSPLYERRQDAGLHMNMRVHRYLYTPKCPLADRNAHSARQLPVKRLVFLNGRRESRNLRWWVPSGLFNSGQTCKNSRSRRYYFPQTHRPLTSDASAQILSTVT